MIEITIKWGTDKEEIKTYKFDNEEQTSIKRGENIGKKTIRRKFKLVVDYVWELI